MTTSEEFTNVYIPATVSDEKENSDGFATFVSVALLATAAVVAGNETNGSPQVSEKVIMTETTTDSVPAGPTLQIETTAGPIKIRLYDDTPLHRDNFLKLAKEGYYDGVLFHRVIKDFMVQTGDPDSKIRSTRCHARSRQP